MSPLRAARSAPPHRGLPRLPGYRRQSDRLADGAAVGRRGPKQDANRIQQIFSAEKKPMLWRVLPAIERLQTAWEAKQDEKKYAIYREALNDGLDKLRKYYTRFDEKPVYILALGTSYIDMI